MELIGYIVDDFTRIASILLFVLFCVGLLAFLLFIIAILLAPKHKENAYNNLSSRFNIDKSEKELDELAEKLLTEYFESVSP